MRGFFLLCFFFLSDSHANDAMRQTQRQLAQIQENIQQLQAQLQIDDSTRKQVLAVVRSLDQNIAASATELAALQQKQRQQHNTIARLTTQKQALAEHIQANKTTLVKLIQSSHRGHRQDRTALFMALDPVNKRMRNQRFYQYYAKKRVLEIDALAKQGQHYQTVMAALHRQNNIDQTIQHTLQCKQVQLQRLKDQRLHVFNAISDAIAQQQVWLTQQQRNESELLTLLETLQKTLADVTQDLRDYQAFSQAKRRLTWPVKGRIKHRFGDVRRLSKWDGLLFGLAQASPVRATFRGRVVYADTLRGLGLLLVIDHGDGYMSLYGHNTILHKRVGEWVEKNEAIAVADRLYFGLRKYGQAIDPAAWLEPIERS